MSGARSRIGRRSSRRAGRTGGNGSAPCRRISGTSGRRSRCSGPGPWTRPGHRRPCGWAPRRQCGRTAGRRHCTRARCPARRPTPPQWTFGCGRFRRSGRAGRGTDSAAAHSSSAGGAARGRHNSSHSKTPHWAAGCCRSAEVMPAARFAPVRLQMIVHPAASKASASRLFVEVFPLVPTVMTEPCAHLPRSSSSSDGSMASAIFPGRLAAGRLAT